MTTNTLTSNEPAIPGLPRLFSAQQIIDSTGIPRSSFYALVAEGKGPPCLSIGGRKMFVADDVAAWINSLRQSAA